MKNANKAEALRREPVIEALSCVHGRLGTICPHCLGWGGRRMSAVEELLDRLPGMLDELKALRKWKRDVRSALKDVPFEHSALCEQQWRDDWFCKGECTCHVAVITRLLDRATE